MSQIPSYHLSAGGGEAEQRGQGAGVVKLSVCRPAQSILIGTSKLVKQCVILIFDIPISQLKVNRSSKTGMTEVEVCIF